LTPLNACDIQRSASM